MKKLKDSVLKLDKEVISLLSVNELNGVKGGIDIPTLPTTTKEGQSICVICDPKTKLVAACEQTVAGNTCFRTQRLCFVTEDCPVELG